MHMGLGLGITRQQGGGFNIAAAFTATGAKGFVLDASIGNLFQDTAQTQPVTAAGQTVAYVRDVSGLGFAFQQATAANRPVYQVSGSRQYLQFQTNKFLQSVSAVNLTDRDCSAVVAGMRKVSDTAWGVVFEHTAGTAGRFTLSAPRTAAANYEFSSGGTAIAGAITANVYAAPETAVISGQGEISADSVTTRRNGVQVGTFAGDQGTGNYNNASMYIGARAGTSNFADMELSHLVVMVTTTPLALAILQQVEALSASKAGVTF